MDTKHNKKGFAKWLETLQQESWQLELIISGFAVFLLAGAYEPLNDWQQELNRIKALKFGYSFNFIDTGLRMTRFVWHILFINLLVHVFLRGLWISTIGLRYVSGDIAFDELKLSAKFNRFLQTKIGSFDDYVETLEKTCSVIFAFTFLLFFITLSATFGLIFLISITELIRNFSSLDYQDLFYPLHLPFFILAGIYILDFITLGWLKKQEKITKLYYPIYRFFSFVSLAFLYRPLYYNLIDNRFGRRVGLLAIPYLLILIGLSGLRLNIYSLPGIERNQRLNIYYYDDTRLANTTLSRVSIPSKYVKNGFLELFLPFKPVMHKKVLYEICPNLSDTPADIIQKESVTPLRKLAADSTLNCFANLYTITIDDSLQMATKYRFYYHPKRKEQGLLTIIDVDKLSRGEHIIEIKTKYIYDSKIFKKTEKEEPIKTRTYEFPFWKE